MTRDLNGREIKPGDLIRVYHYTDRRTKRKCYMHKLVVRVDGNLNVSKDGKYLYGVDVVDIWKKGSLDKAHKYRLVDGAENAEIIDGSSVYNGVDEIQTWYERPKSK